MKNAYRQSLYLGLSISFLLLIAWWAAKEEETESRERLEPDASDALPPIPTNGRPVAFPEPSFRPVSATTVTFHGTVIRSGSRFALRETAGVLYTLDSTGAAWPYEGEDVRITGNLEPSSRLLHVQAIEAAPV